MRRAHRRAHLFMWRLVALVVVAGLVLAWMVRRDPPIEPRGAGGAPAQTAEQ